ncbi:DUF3034 family protein [Sphingomonas oligophenolica]|uniref:DUF3034 family protein n=1 Tax=Sphingomonas oligophenolica TaxID=301154 RepID=A0A502CM72_9SPHN|nr:DUF3034 family protein [Sphingomonas oligophenolica]TPG13650.1 DUF3034 family protein [Sphingomonas oligophenolica]
MSLSTRKLLPVVAALSIIAVVAPADAAERREGGKLLLTGGMSSIEGAAGGGLATWAVIAGDETEDGTGGTAHATYVALPDFDLASAGAAIGISDLVELSYAYQRFDTRAAGAALGLGRGFTFGQHVLGAKLRVIGDAVWDQDTLLPQIAVGAQYKIAEHGNIIRAVGGRDYKGVDFYVAATKVWLPASMVFNATVRFTKANQFGLLGFGGDKQPGRTAQVEGSAGKLLARNLLVGVEYRMKPNNLNFARETDSYDLFAAWAIQRHLSITAAYADLGAIATVEKQRGLFMSLQGGF